MSKPMNNPRQPNMGRPMKKARKGTFGRLMKYVFSFYKKGRFLSTFPSKMAKKNIFPVFFRKKP